MLLARDRLAEDHALELRVIEEHNAWRARGVARDGSRRMSRAPAQLEPPPAPTGQANMPEGGVARCNPVNARRFCRDDRLEPDRRR